MDRIEPQTPNTKRPEKPVVYTYGKLLIGWPIKLAFAPLLASNILNYLSEMKIAPSGALNEIKSVVPDIAPRPW